MAVIWMVRTLYTNPEMLLCSHRYLCRIAANKQSLEVSYTHLSAALPILAVWTADVPTQMLEIYDRVVKQISVEMFSNYDDIATEMFVRIADLPIADSIRDLRCALGLKTVAKCRTLHDTVH